MARKTIRLTASLDAQIDRAAREGGFKSSTAFIRAAAELAVKGDSVAALNEAEQRLLASLDSIAREVRSIRRSQQAIFAFLDSLVKTLLTCLPEPHGDTHAAAVARGKMRYERFLKSVGAGLAGDARGGLAEAQLNGDEER